ncbi:unnamed protein product [Pedinophyceae sp. YPF-701]|nr:unnamed protein product [Pedinophyceae sp. YPF-701]
MVPNPVTVCAHSVSSFVEERDAALARTFVGRTLSSQEFVANFQGVTVDLVDVLLRLQLGWQYQVKVYEDINVMLYAVRKGVDCDFAASAISITAARESCDARCTDPAAGEAAVARHACCLDFTADYFPSGTAILSKWSRATSDGGLTSVFRKFIDPGLVNALSTTFIALMVVAHVLWLIESRVQPNRIHPKYMEGIDEGLWLSIVTLTTVGYGDYYPVSGLGRLSTALWMIIGLLFTSSINGILASVWIEARDNSPVFVGSLSALNGLRVCTTPGALASSLRNVAPASLALVSTQRECIDGLIAGQYDAAAIDWAVGVSVIERNTVPDDVALTGILWPGPLAFAFAEGAPLEGPVNAALLTYLEGGEDAVKIPSFADITGDFFAGERGPKGVSNLALFGDGETEIDKQNATLDTTGEYAWGVIGAALGMIFLWALFFLVVQYVRMKRRRELLQRRMAPQKLQRQVTLDGDDDNGIIAGEQADKVDPLRKMEKKTSLRHIGEGSKRLFSGMTMLLNKGLGELAAAIADVEVAVQEDAEKLQDNIVDDIVGPPPDVGAPAPANGAAGADGANGNPVSAGGVPANDALAQVSRRLSVEVPGGPAGVPPPATPSAVALAMAGSAAPASVAPGEDVSDVVQYLKLADARQRIISRVLMLLATGSSGLSADKLMEVDELDAALEKLDELSAVKRKQAAMERLARGSRLPSVPESRALSEYRPSNQGDSAVLDTGRGGSQRAALSPMGGAPPGTARFRAPPRVAGSSSSDKA